MQAAGEFENRLRIFLRQSLNNNHVDNHVKYYYYGLLRAKYLDMIALEAFTPEQRLEKLDQAEETVREVLENMAPLYARLADAHSRDTLIMVAAYAVIGYRHVKFPYYRADAIERRELLAARTRVEDAPEMLDLLTKLRREWFSEDIALYNLYAVGRSLLLYSTPETLYMELFQPAYTYRYGGVDISVGPGDLVIDCGAAFGDQALFFAEPAGPDGLVICLEPHPENRKICFKNMELNTRLRGRIRLFPVGAWHEDRVTLTLHREGASSSLLGGDTNTTDSVQVRCRTIDSLVAELPRQDVSFLKMDIEGAETAALRGAEETIRRCGPKLALSIYHSLEDFRRIPALIDAVRPGYRFFLDHHSVCASDTVLYGSVDG